MASHRVKPLALPPTENSPGSSPRVVSMGDYQAATGVIPNKYSVIQQLAVSPRPDGGYQTVFVGQLVDTKTESQVGTGSPRSGSRLESRSNGVSASSTSSVLSVDSDVPIVDLAPQVINNTPTDFALIDFTISDLMIHMSSDTSMLNMLVDPEYKFWERYVRASFTSGNHAFMRDFSDSEGVIDYCQGAQYFCSIMDKYKPARLANQPATIEDAKDPTIHRRAPSKNNRGLGGWLTSLVSPRVRSNTASSIDRSVAMAASDLRPGSDRSTSSAPASAAVSPSPGSESGRFTIGTGRTASFSPRSSPNISPPRPTDYTPSPLSQTSDHITSFITTPLPSQQDTVTNGENACISGPRDRRLISNNLLRPASSSYIQRPPQLHHASPRRSGSDIVSPLPSTVLNSKLLVVRHMPIHSIDKALEYGMDVWLSRHGLTINDTVTGVPADENILRRRRFLALMSGNIECVKLFDHMLYTSELMTFADSGGSLEVSRFVHDRILRDAPLVRQKALESRVSYVETVPRLEDSTKICEICCQRDDIITFRNNINSNKLPFYHLAVSHSAVHILRYLCEMYQNPILNICTYDPRPGLFDFAVQSSKLRAAQYLLIYSHRNTLSYCMNHQSVEMLDFLYNAGKIDPANIMMDRTHSPDVTIWLRKHIKRRTSVLDFSPLDNNQRWDEEGLPRGE